MKNLHISGPTSNRIEWADVYFTACADREVFNDVTLITAKSDYAELAFQAAADIVLKSSGGRPAPATIYKVATRLMDERRVYSQECVRVMDNGITVCVNAVSVENDDVVWRALDMLADAIRHLDGQIGNVFFGDKLYFSSSEIQLATTH